MSTDLIRVAVADDSAFVRKLIASYLPPEEGFTVVAEAADGIEAVDAVMRTQPDVMTLDLEMPEMDGLEALRTIMQTRPTPVIAISGVSGQGATRTMQALDVGAVDFVLKFTPGLAIDPAAMAREIAEKVRLAARIQVVRLLERSAEGASVVPKTSTADLAALAASVSGALPNVVVIGASTGGPVALRELLAELPHGFRAAVVVVQHIPAFFTTVLASQLNRYCRLNVREALPGDILTPGVVYVAPGGYHFLLQSGLRVHLQKGLETPGTHCPSIDVTMESAARLLGARITGVLLSGMGADGAAGLLAIRRGGGRTFAQDEATSVVYGMPKRAVELGAALAIDTPSGIGAALARDYAPLASTTQEELLHVKRLEPGGARSAADAMLRRWRFLLSQCRANPLGASQGRVAAELAQRFSARLDQARWRRGCYPRPGARDWRGASERGGQRGRRGQPGRPAGLGRRDRRPRD